MPFLYVRIENPFTMKTLITLIFSILIQFQLFSNRDSSKVWLFITGANQKIFKTENLNNLLRANNYPTIENRFTYQSIHLGLVQNRFSLDLGVGGFRHSTETVLSGNDLNSTHFRQVALELNFTYDLLNSNTFILGPTLGYHYFWNSVGLQSRDIFTSGIDLDSKIRKLTNEGFEFLLGLDFRFLFKKLNPDQLNWMFGLRVGYILNFNHDWYQENIVPFVNQNLMSGRWGISLRCGI